MGQSTHNPLIDRVRRLFGDVPCRVQVAALPWRKSDDGVEVMLITSRDTGRWVLPKGWPEGKEKPWDAAAREAKEEAGLSGSVAKSEAGSYFYTKAMNKGDDIPCEVLVYPLEVDRVAEKWKERKERMRRWVPASEAATMVVESELGDLINAFAARPRSFF